MDNRIKPGSVVKYNGNYFILWSITVLDRAQLITPEGYKFTGTPHKSKLEFIKNLPVVTFNHTRYVVDRNNRIFSLATGNLCYETDRPERSRILSEVVVGV